MLAKNSLAGILSAQNEFLHHASRVEFTGKSRSLDVQTDGSE